MTLTTINIPNTHLPKVIFNVQAGQWEKELNESEDCSINSDAIIKTQICDAKYQSISS